MICIKSANGWQPVGKPITAKPEKAWPDQDQARLERHKTSYEALFMHPVVGDMRLHPKFGQGLHRYV